MLNPSSLLDPSVSHDTVIGVARRSWQRVQYGEYVLSLALWRLRRDQVHRGKGFSRIQDYAEYLFNIPERLGSLFVVVGRHLERLPLSRAAMERGELTYTKFREYMSIAEPEDEAVWIEYANSHTNRQLEEKVARTRAEREGREYESTKTVKSELNGMQVQAARKAREILAGEGGAPVPEAELLPRLLDKLAEGELFASPAGEDGENGKPAAKPVGPYLSIGLCVKCLHTWVPVARQDMELSPEKWIEEMRKGGEVMNLLPDILCDCEDVMHRRDECPQFAAVEEKAASSRHVPAEVRRLIEARDGFRCRVPECGNTVALEGGHMETPFRDGAPNDTRNVGEQCSVHNREIETGALRVVGHAPFEKYYLRDGTFLGWGFDPEAFEQKNHHVGNGVEAGKRAPPVPSGG